VLHRFTLRDECPVSGTSAIATETLWASLAADCYTLPCRKHSHERT